MAFDHAKFLARFVAEAKEHCSRLTAGLLELESAAGDTEQLNSLFRSAHTIKGSARMMKLAGINELAHRLEDVLDAVRAGAIAVNGPLTDLLFKGVDGLIALLEEVEAGKPCPEAPAALCERLSQAAAAPGSDPPAEQAAAPGSDPPAEQAAAPAPAPLPEPPGEAARDTQPPAPVEPAAPAARDIQPPAPVEPAAPPAPEETLRKAKPADYLRVNAAKLDELIGLMGEIVSEHVKGKGLLARLRELEGQAGRAPAGEGAGGGEGGRSRKRRQLLRAMQDGSRLQEHLVGGLQEIALKLRMQPLATIFDPLRRAVRDLARERNLEVNFLVEGGDTELDRKIIERLGDSLTHMIRNALDHGLESAAAREAAGKPGRGTIRLLAAYDSSGVLLTMSDDGCGIPVEKIKAKALGKNLFAPETLDTMSRAEIINLIFLPGFSTSPIITDLSGRGVGMDVVRRNIVEELRGSIYVESDEGRGTRISLRLPLNLAIFPLFLVSIAAWPLALPATAVVEVLTVRSEEIIEVVRARAIRLRNQLIPVTELAGLLAFPRPDAAATGSPAEGSPRPPAGHTLVIIRDGEEKLGLLVDGIIGRQEMVVKPLPAPLRRLRLLSGVTIGEGDKIIGVLQVPELIRRARESTLPASRPAAEQGGEKRSTVLVVDDSFNTRELEKSILEAYGYQVTTAEDGQEALEMTRDTLFDLVITDVEMPRLDGFTLTERLRGDARYRKVPVIIVTSREKEEDKRRGIKVGADAYIVKGAFDQSNLLETVRSLIG